MPRLTFILITLVLVLGAVAVVASNKLVDALNDNVELSTKYDALQAVTTDFEDAVEQRDKAIDTHLQEIEDIKHAHELLVASISAGEFGVRIKATCPVQGEETPSSAPPTARAAELTGKARQDYLDFRVAYQYQLSTFKELQRYCQ